MVAEKSTTTLLTRMGHKMNTGKTENLAIVTTIVVAFVLSFPAYAQSAADALYKSKCAMCHGADGTKIASHDLQAAGVQKMSDAELSTVITNGKGSMPASKSLKPEEVEGLVTYLRTLKK